MPNMRGASAVLIVFLFGIALSAAEPPRDLSNFQGFHRCPKETLIARPETYNELRYTVKNHKRVQAVGAGHSWDHRYFCPDSSQGDSVGITMTTLRRQIYVNETEETVIVSGGVKQRFLLDYLSSFGTEDGGSGWTLPAFSWFIDQTIAGAIATDTHGSTAKFGSLSSTEQLLDIWLMTANGTVVHLNDEINPHLMRAARVSVGRLGVIIFVKMRIVPQLRVKRVSEKMNPDDVSSLLLKAETQYKNTGKIPNNLNELQIFWFPANKLLWHVSFERISPLVSAFGGPDDWPTGVPRPNGEKEVDNSIATGWRNPVEIRPNPGVLSRLFPINIATSLYQSFFYNEFIANGIYAARKSYLSMTETGRDLTGNIPYDQYEFAIPLETAGTCFSALMTRTYKPFQRLDGGFRSPALIRFVNEVDAYLSPTQAGPAMYINLEDYLFYSNGRRRNERFQEVIRFIKEEEACRGSRLHWGKAGWPDDGCYDAEVDYPETWCHFGCAANELDPTHKFKQESSVLHWNVTQLNNCCGSEGFDDSLPGCSSGCRAKFPTLERMNSPECEYTPKHPSKRYPELWK